MFTTPLHAFLQGVKTHPEKIYLRQPIQGVYQNYTWQDTARQARNMAFQLSQFGVQKGDRVALWSKNCAEWIMADLAIMMAGAVCVPLYPGQSKDNVEFVLEHSGAKVIFVGKHDDDVPVEQSLPDSIPKIGFRYYTGKTQHSWSVLAEHPAPATFQINDPKPDDMMTIVYTSGTTGKPKGAVHTYRTFGFAAANMVEQHKLSDKDRMFSFLPLAHVAERVLVEGLSFYARTTVAFAESLDTFADNLNTIKPTLFFAVPRLWAKFQEKIIAKVGEQKLNKLLSIPLVSSLIKKKIKKGLGLDQARIIGCGASPMPKALLEWYDRVGIRIQEGYGMTENCCYGTVNMANDIRMGSVGKKLQNSEVKISEQGEILMKSGALMTGYYKDPEKTAEAIVDGFYHTGDKGRIDENGFIFITGRVKELFKTAKGKYIAPAPLEGLLAAHPHIEQCCVMGSGKSQPVVVVELSETARALDAAEVVAAVEAHLAHVNRQLEHHEMIEQVLLTTTTWTVEGGLITPTLKIRREQVEELYLPMLEAQPGAVVCWDNVSRKETVAA